MTLASGLVTRQHALARYRSEFPIFRDKVYLNTCSLGALGMMRVGSLRFSAWRCR